MKKIYHLAVEATLDVIGGKWKPIILCHLGFSKLRPSELQHKIKNISPRVLTKQLRELEEDGIINRIVYPEIPPKVEYELSEEGKSLRNILLAMSDWGEARVLQEQEKGKDISIINQSHAGFEKMNKN